MTPPRDRLKHVLSALSSPPEVVGTLRLGNDVTYDVLAAGAPARLPRTPPIPALRSQTSLTSGAVDNDEGHDEEYDDVRTREHFRWLLQKRVLGQDVFLVGQPGPYARRLAMSFARLINAEYEYVALHRDVGETEIKQGREIKAGGNLVHVDSAVVRAVKHGRVLILEGIEKAERGIMPILNNLLENREMNLDDGTHIVHHHRYAQLEAQAQDPGAPMSGARFVPASKDFRVIAIAAPVPQYPGYPLDPPFRSRFQARFIDPVDALLTLGSVSPGALSDPISSLLFERLRDVILTVQYASETRDAFGSNSAPTLPPFPQTALQKLRALVSVFPPQERYGSPAQLALLLLAVHPRLAYVPEAAWRTLERLVSDAGVGELGRPWTLDEKAADGQQQEHQGFFGYGIAGIWHEGEHTTRVTFRGPPGRPSVTVVVPAGPRPLRAFPFKSGELGMLELTPSPRFLGLLTCCLQAHALGWDISLIPPPAHSTASTSTLTLVRVFGELLGYEIESVHMYKELGGRDLIMRRKVEDSGATTWEPSPIIDGACRGSLVHLSGLDVLGATAGSLARLTQDREAELWEGKRMVEEATVQELASGELSAAHRSFRIIATSSKSMPLKDWLSDEHANMFFTIPTQPMSLEEEMATLTVTGCASLFLEPLLSFAVKYRASMVVDNVQKNRKLGTRTLVRIAQRLARFPQDDDLYAIISRALLAEFLPAAEQLRLDDLFKEVSILKKSPLFNPPPVLLKNSVLFPDAGGAPATSLGIPCFDPLQDPEGVASHVPHMDHFYDNSSQTGLMRDLALDLEVLGEHVVLLGNQGVGKNKIVDRLCQLLGRPREYVQLHRDTTVNQLMFTTSLDGGVIKHIDSPLLRAIAHGRVIIVDEVDKAPEHVVAVLRSLSGQKGMSLSDGRRVHPVYERKGDIAVHPNFRLVLLGNRPGYPFLGNHFLQVLGDNFSYHSVSNPDQESEREILLQLAPEIGEGTINQLVAIFQDLRRAWDAGTVGYPYSLRELINLVRHMRKYPDDSMGAALRNVFDFDLYNLDTMDQLVKILERHGIRSQDIGRDGIRNTSKRVDMQFEPTESAENSEPKEGEHDPENRPHVGGTRWAGGTGGRGTAGLGGTGGYKRLDKGHQIHQVSREIKDAVPDAIKEKARELARQELQRRLDELEMSAGDAESYGKLLRAVQSNIASLHSLLENLAAREEERVWIKRRTDGELDDSRLTETLTGENTVYKRRGSERPEPGRPQIKPKRIRFVFDISGSMYRFQYDGRLQRSLETAVMLMEAFARLSRKEKYVWDMYGHSGDSPLIPLVPADNPPIAFRDRWKVIEKMMMVTQYAFSGDYTLEAIEKGVAEVAKFDADDWCVIAITDVNFGHYQVTEDELKRAMNSNPKVHTVLICIGDGAEMRWVPQALPGRAFRVKETGSIPVVLKSILAGMVER